MSALGSVDTKTSTSDRRVSGGGLCKSLPVRAPNSDSGTVRGMFVATTKTSTVVEARRRAREAKAALDAERAKRDAEIEELTTTYYVAVGSVEELREQIEQAQAKADEAVRSLLELGEPADRVATLTGLKTKEVRRIRREAASDSDGVQDGDTKEGAAEAAAPDPATPVRAVESEAAGHSEGDSERPAPVAV